ncbi:MAG: biopolymer transporter Tol [Opitutaceae bacterium]
MQKFLSLFLLAALTMLAHGQPARDMEIVVYGDSNAIPVRVTASTPELTALAQQAFSVHGRYKLVTTGHAYEIKFSLVSATQVRVEITKGAAGAPFFPGEVATGTSTRNALLRAADIAVVKTNGQGLRGFFTAKLAFIRDQGRVKEVCVSDLLFGEVKQVTHDNALALTPRWAPDGTKLLYTSYYKSGSPDIFQINLGTNQRTNFVSFRGTNTGAHFSPNGSQVAMILTGEGTTEIYTSSAQGGRVSRVAKTRTDAAKSSPCFSPDGSRIVFAMEPGPQLYVMPVSGGTPQRVFRDFGYAAEPDWSMTKPNLIACTVRSGGFQIAVYDFNTNKATVVSKAPFDGIEPSWLADGRHLVYTARTRTESRVCILDTETGRTAFISPKAFGNASQASAWTP